MTEKVISLNSSEETKNNKWLGADPLVKIIEKKLKKTNLVEDKNGIKHWQEFIHPGLSIIHRVYNRTEDCFFIQEAAISRIPTPSPELMQYLLEAQSSCHLPYRFAHRDGFLLINLHCFLNGLSEENLTIRLVSFKKHCISEHEYLSERFGIKPLHPPKHSLLEK